MRRAILLGILGMATFCAQWRTQAQDPVGLYMAGRYAFQEHCVVCHGSTGRGDGPWAAGLEVKPRNFRAGLYKFRSTPYGKLPVDEDLRRTIRQGISGTAMPMFTHLRDDDVEALIAYLKQLSRRWDDPEQAAAPVRLPGTPVWFGSDPERAAHAAKGGATFAARCAGCHGTSGRGDGPIAQGLLDAWGQPIHPADLSAPHPRSGDAPADLYRTVATGWNGTPMLGFAGELSETEMWDVVAWIVEGRR